MKRYLLSLVIPLAVLICLTASLPMSVADDAKPKDVAVKDITLAVPAGWQQSPPSNRLRLAQFEIPAAKGDAEPAELVISSFGGGGGGVEANIQRWVGQFASKGRESKIVTGESPQGKYVLVDVQGTYNKPDGPPVLRKTKPMPGSRMLAVILAVPGKGNYFLKLTGLQSTVKAAAADFRRSFGGQEKSEKGYEAGNESS